MRILLLLKNGHLTTLVGGGEKIFSEFADEFARRGFKVGAIHDDPVGEPFVFPIKSSVSLFNLRAIKFFSPSLVAAKIWREITRPLSKTFLAPIFLDFRPMVKSKILKRKIDRALLAFRPDVVVSFFPTDVQALFLNRCETNFATIQMIHFAPNLFFQIFEELCPLLNRCDVVQTLLPSFIEPMRSVCSTEIVAIPNAVPQFSESVDVDERERAGSPRIVCVARLDEQIKRQHVAIEAFAKIADACPDWTLHFYGDSYPEPAYGRRLQKQISAHNLQNRVFLHPSTSNVKQELLSSDIFAFPSPSEGFGVALGEALSAGLPAVGFADAPAVNELIVDGENGFLATDVDDFAQKLKTLIESKELRRRFGANAKKSVEKYEASRVWDAWETLLRETVEKKRAQIAARALK